MEQLTRRDFVKATAVAAGAAAGVLSARNVLALEFLKPVADPLGAYPYRGWETLYRDQVSYDKIARSTHSLNCTGSCTWKVFVKNGIAFKEEQYADYPDISPDLPTYNPRGCQKGANYLEYVYGDQRLKYPLIRAGKRGEGKWRRATWDEALDYIAGKIVNAVKIEGPGSVNFYAAIPAKHHLTLAGGFRLANLLGGVVNSFYDWYCDLPPGEPMTWGVQTDSCESADWFNSKYIILSGANLLETRIPDSHFFTEARMNGAKIVCISPEYNPSSIHADIYVPIKPGTEAALMLGMANVIVNEGLHDAPYLKQFTDFPILVRKDNGKFLRLSDNPASPDFNKYYLWDTVENKAVIAPGSLGFMPPTASTITVAGSNGDEANDRGEAHRFMPASIPEDGSDTPAWTLELGSVDPALEGDFSVNGVKVTTVFSLLKKKLADYEPTNVSGITGVDADLITKIAREFATIKPGKMIEGAGTNHYYHNDLINRAQILLVALTGNVGKQGGGFDHYVGQEKLWAEHGFFQLAFPHGRPKQRFQPTTLWTYWHAETQSDVDALGIWKKTINQYIKTSVDKKWMPLYPEGALKGKNPKVMIIWGANYLNQSKGYEDVRDVLFPKLDLVVDINFHMDTTAFYADVVLPAASLYEKWDLNTSDLHTYIHPLTPVLEPQHESRTDWQIWQALAKKLQDKFIKEKFTALNDTVYFTGQTVTRRYDTLLSDFQNLNTGGVNVADDKAAAQFLLDNSPETKGLTNDMINEHPRRFNNASADWTSDIIDGKAYYGFQRMTEKKRPLTTQTGRQQFYIDHDWFLDFKEELPVYKPPLEADKYPLRWITPHGRWSVHSTYRNAKFQLRLQRGRPVVYLSPKEASARGLQDDDLVRVYNAHGSFEAHLYISPRMPDGMAQMYHGWERYFTNKGWQSPTIIRIKPTQLVGKYGQLSFRLNYWGPTGNQKDTRVEIEFVSR